MILMIENMPVADTREARWKPAPTKSNIKKIESVRQAMKEKVQACKEPEVAGQDRK
jgi:hypothetical protein